MQHDIGALWRIQGPAVPVCRAGGICQEDMVERDRIHDGCGQELYSALHPVLLRVGIKEAELPRLEGGGRRHHLGIKVNDLAHRGLRAFGLGVGCNHFHLRGQRRDFAHVELGHGARLRQLEAPARLHFAAVRRPGDALRTGLQLHGHGQVQSRARELSSAHLQVVVVLLRLELGDVDGGRAAEADHGILVVVIRIPVKAIGLSADGRIQEMAVPFAGGFLEAGRCNLAKEAPLLVLPVEVVVSDGIFRLCSVEQDASRNDALSSI
mmetsp:Transcript_122617/g.291588  ORF Transcript_122617/g.291588 Transcript_122617/m.291588 type:complete len:266 (+) Transcript_122617:1585-2382(+)